MEDEETPKLEIPSTMVDIVETTFSFDDEPVELYKRLESALEQTKYALTPNVLRSQLVENPILYRLANKLYILARYEFEKFDHRYEQEMAMMRQTASIHLNREKAEGRRSKAPTIKDIEDRAMALFPEEIEEANDNRVRLRETVEDLKHLVDVFKARGFSLRAILGSKEEL